MLFFNVLVTSIIGQQPVTCCAENLSSKVHLLLCIIHLDDTVKENLQERDEFSTNWEKQPIILIYLCANTVEIFAKVVLTYAIIPACTI